MNPEIEINTQIAVQMNAYFNVPANQLHHHANQQAAIQNRINQLVLERKYLINYSLQIDESETTRMDHNIRYGKPHFTIDLDDQEAIFNEVKRLEARIRLLGGRY